MLEINGIGKVYRVGVLGNTRVNAVREVSFALGPGEVVSVIGESGSGKTTLGRMILRLTPASTGTITFAGKDIAALRGRALKNYYREVQGVFQDPFSSYNPVFKADRVFAMIRAGYFPGLSGAAWRTRVTEALAAVRLTPEAVLDKYPHQLSGGQLQRMLIARALLLDIRVLVADEIISMLDASTRIDVLNLLGDLKERGLAIVFITHDLALGNYISDRTLILRRGDVVECGATGAVFGNPVHPYTRRLLSSVPRLHKKWGQVAAELTEPPGRCPVHANGSAAALVEVAPEHQVACLAAGADQPCPDGVTAGHADR
ncbi:ABC transporter ATP-binding protein [Actinophytocola sp.]|uniref:ABC transporter ATP-binding protein n=1 Tax=Actinophytocola sp. TaxID=1872138 RepID=UPI002D7F8601|nr:ATP-binding cassette domain-containing protein [Actinophytocola sp.]HET9141824.1 ATP-binding cassette domain-containing protein [Actinophytocola sp.]